MGSEAPLSRGLQLKPILLHWLRKEGHQSLAPCETPAVALATGKTGCRTKPYSTSSGMSSGSSAIRSKNGVSTNVLSKSNHTHGEVTTEIHAQDSPRVRLGFIYGKLSYVQGFV
jgi:hypothetical protein